MQNASVTIVTAAKDQIESFAVYVDSILVKSGTNFSVRTLMEVVREQGLDNVAVNYNHETANKLLRETCFGRHYTFERALCKHFANLKPLLD